MSMITALAWVPRGHAAPFPQKYVFNEEEFARISSLSKLELDDAKEELAKAQGTGAGDASDSEDDKDDDGDVYVRCPDKRNRRRMRD